MYEGLFDQDRMILMEIEDPSKKQYVQTGYYDKDILCGVCDNELIAGWERYASGLLYGKVPTGHSQEFKVVPGKGTVMQVQLHYAQFKLFVLSILWRAHISTNPFFAKVKVPEHEALLRHMLLSQDPGSEDQFRTAVFCIRGFKGQPIGMIPNPGVSDNEVGHIAHFFINGMLYLIELPPPAPPDHSPIFDHFALKGTGNLEIPQLQGELAQRMLRAIGIKDDVVQYFTTDQYRSSDDLAFDLKTKLDEYFPALREIIGDDNFRWREVASKFHQHHAERVLQYMQSGGQLTVEANFYDVIVKSMTGDQTASRFLGMFSALFTALSKKLNEQQKAQLKSTIYAFLTSFDNKYLNFTGELLVLNHLLQTGDFSLLDKEFPLLNGKKADFRLLHIPQQKETIIEILNIQLKKGVDDNPELVRKFITKRLQDKIEQKTRGKALARSFALIPVFWGPREDLRKLGKFYAHNTIDVPGTLEGVAYSVEIYANQQFIYKFGALSTLFPGRNM